MSDNKFSSRGFGSSHGVSAGGWSGNARYGETSSAQRPSDAGTSFVLGGGVGGGRRSTKSQGAYREERYKFDADEIIAKGSVKHVDPRSQSFSGASLSVAMSSARGQKVLLALIFYGIFLAGLIYVVIACFGSGNSPDYYTPPPDLSDGLRPLWATGD